MAERLQPVSVTASTLTLDSTHHGTVLKANRAAGITFTLPDATGDGNHFRILVETTITSNSLIVQAPDADNIMTGTALNAQDSADTAVMFETASDTDTVTLNGSTTGGIKGDMLEFIDVSADLWFVRIVGSATGTEATPFSAAVS